MRNQITIEIFFSVQLEEDLLKFLHLSDRVLSVLVSVLLGSLVSSFLVVILFLPWTLFTAFLCSFFRLIRLSMLLFGRGSRPMSRFLLSLSRWFRCSVIHLSDAAFVHFSILVLASPAANPAQDEV